MLSFRPATACVQLRGQAEISGETAGELRADPLTRRRGVEHGPVLHVARARTRVPALLDVHLVLSLRQEPEVVVALDRVARVPVADADLYVEDLLGWIPDLAQPAQAEARLRAQRGVLAGEVPLCELQ